MVRVVELVVTMLIGLKLVVQVLLDRDILVELKANLTTQEEEEVLRVLAWAVS